MTIDTNSDQPMDGQTVEHAACVGVRLELPSERYVESFLEAMREFQAEGKPEFTANITREQFSAHVRQLSDQAAGKNLKEGHVPSKEFWITDAEGYAGKIILGLAFIPTPCRVGHHVGYAVRPSKRGRGYATTALRLLIEEARNLKIEKLMPTCGASNFASRKVIERNGGILLDPDQNPPADELSFIIDLSTRPA